MQLVSHGICSHLNNMYFSSLMMIDLGSQTRTIYGYRTMLDNKEY